jgi:heat shock protein HtpX
MFELIRANKRKSAGLILLLGGLLMFLGLVAGAMVAPGDPGVQGVFVVVAVGIWLVLLLTSLLGGEAVLLASANAKEVQHKDAPQLYNIVEEMCIASGLAKVPKVYLIDTPDPNAFAVGLKPERAAVAVTTGLMAKLNRDELQAVMAHEIAHIQNRDTLFMTMAGVTVGAIVILGDLMMRSMFYSSLGRSRGSRDNNQGAAIMMVLALVMAILAPILANLLYFACSRRREYLADACAAQYTRYPEGLASALEKISGQLARRTEKKQENRTLAPMYIVNPMAARGSRTGWFSTHPATEDRVRVLRAMGGSASLAAYEQAYASLHGKSSVLPASVRAASVEQPAREAAAPLAGGRRQWREVQDLLHQVDRFAVLACACGMKLKLPPDYAQAQVACPKCGARHAVPRLAG